MLIIVLAIIVVPVAIFFAAGLLGAFDEEPMPVTYANLSENEQAAFICALKVGANFAKDPSTVRLNHAYANPKEGGLLRPVIDEKKSNEVLVERGSSHLDPYVFCNIIPDEEDYKGDLFKRKMRVYEKVKDDAVDAKKVNEALDNYWAGHDEKAPEVDFVGGDLTAYNLLLDIGARYFYDPSRMRAASIRIGEDGALINADGMELMVTYKDGQAIYTDVTLANFSTNQDYHDLWKSLENKEIESPFEISEAAKKYWKAVMS